MPIAVTGDLVTGGGDGSNQLRLALGDPPEDEERRLYAVPLEQPQDSLGIRSHAAIERVPRIPVDHIRERLDMKIVLDIER